MSEDNQIETIDKYLGLFPEGSRKEALDYAIQERHFEIELYWKRAAYAWTLIAAAFTAYFLAEGVENDHVRETLTSIISGLGFFLSLGAMLMNRGSKFWQEHWEHKVELLEDSVIGPLYKTASIRKQYPFWKLFDGYFISVTRLNSALSLIVFVGWSILFLHPILKKCSTNFGAALLVIGTMVVFIAGLGYASSAKKEKNTRINVRVRKLENADGTLADSGKKAPPNTQIEPS